MSRSIALGIEGTSVGAVPPATYRSFATELYRGMVYRRLDDYQVIARDDSGWVFTLVVKRRALPADTWTGAIEFALDEIGKDQQDMRRRTAPRLGPDGEYLRFQTEAELMNAIELHARQLGYLVFHDELARGKYRGFPDLTICGHGVALFVECKGPKNSTTDHQDAWIEQLTAAGEIAIVASTERNSDYENICAHLDAHYQASVIGDQLIYGTKEIDNE